MGPAVPISKGYVRDRPHLYQRNIRYMFGSGRTYLKRICKRPAAPISKEYSILSMGPAVPISKGYVRDRPHLYQRNIRVMHGDGSNYLKGRLKRPAAPIAKEYCFYASGRPYLSQKDM